MCIPIGSVTFAWRVLQFTRLFAARNIPYTEQQGNFITVHCVRLITTPLKYMTLYFNIQRHLIRNFTFFRDNINVDITTSINGSAILVNFVSDK